MTDLNTMPKIQDLSPLPASHIDLKQKGKVQALTKLIDRLKAYNQEFDTWDDLVHISQKFMDDINHEVSQGSGEIPFELFQKEKEFFLQLPRLEILQNYISRQEDKTYPVNIESMNKYEGKTQYLLVTQAK